MDNTAITLKFDEIEFERIQQTLANIDAKLSAISLIDLCGVSENVSHGHYLLISQITDELNMISKSLNSAIA